MEFWILSDQDELLHANDCSRRILRLLNRKKHMIDLVPEEIWHVCQSLIESRSLFPEQHWVMESNIFINSSTIINVRARWLGTDVVENPCLLLTMRDQYQSIKNIAATEFLKCGLTSREREIWLLHRANYTYKQIATELNITPNTVKKYMKSIHVKQKDVLGLDD